LGQALGPEVPKQGLLNQFASSTEDAPKQSKKSKGGEEGKTENWKRWQ